MHSKTHEPLTVGKAAFKKFRELRDMTPSSVLYRKCGNEEGLSKTDFWLCHHTYSPKTRQRQPRPWELVEELRCKESTNLTQGWASKVAQTGEKDNKRNRGQQKQLSALFH